MAFIPHVTFTSLTPPPSTSATTTHRYRHRPAPRVRLNSNSNANSTLSPHHSSPLTSRTTVKSALKPVQHEYHITKTVMPVDTDYSGAMWHGNYLKWLEEVRIDYLALRNLPYQHLMNVHRIELPVKNVTMDYFHPARLGDTVKIVIRLGHPVTKVRVNVLTQFIRVEDDQVLANASITVVPIDCDTGKIQRVWPAEMTNAFFEQE